jgi:hypothetical protein
MSDEYDQYWYLRYKSEYIEFPPTAAIPTQFVPITWFVLYQYVYARKNFPRKQVGKNLRAFLLRRYKYNNNITSLPVPFPDVDFNFNLRRAIAIVPLTELPFDWCCAFKESYKKMYSTEYNETHLVSILEIASFLLRCTDRIFVNGFTAENYSMHMQSVSIDCIAPGDIKNFAIKHKISISKYSDVSDLIATYLCDFFAPKIWANRWKGIRLIK